MRSRQPNLGPKSRPERETGRSRWVLQIVSAALLVLASAWRLNGVPWWALILFVSIVAVLVWGLASRGRNRLNELRSLQDLSDTISRSKGTQRYNLTWYEYAIARNMLRGTYNGEKPSDFKMDVYELSAKMGFATKHTLHATLWTFLLIAAGTTAMMTLIEPQGFDGELVVMLVELFAFIFGFTGIFMWLKSLGKMSKLGRRIEEASGLPTEARWTALESIARDELELTSAA